jgi:outer membrane protein OmpA-like peptidoglycan-associated protein
MTSNSLFTKFLPVAVIAATASTLVGCSTVKSISPFSSSVPYSQDVQPTVPKPASSEIPAFRPKPKPDVSVSEAPAPAPAPAPAAAPPAPAPAPTPTPAPTPAAPPPAPTAAPLPPPPPPPPASQSSVAPVGTPKVAEAETPAVPSPEKAAAPGKAAESSDDTEVAGESGKHQSSIPDADRQFKDDGTYPNLAQVPARPVNIPTFLEAKAIEKALVADSAKAKDVSPASPNAPAVDSTPVPVSLLVKPVPVPTAPVVTEAADRAEDHAPCLSGAPADSELAATIHFEPGSAAMTSATLALLTEALPTIRAAKGAIRIFGHGDTETDSATGAGRFDLAAARAGAVAQAVAGYGIPVPRIAVGVACNDAAFAGASVQLYAES